MLQNKIGMKIDINRKYRPLLFAVSLFVMGFLLKERQDDEAGNNVENDNHCE